MNEAVRHTGFIPLPPLIYLVALLAGIALGLFVPLPWLGGVLADLLFAAGWIMAAGALALWFSAIRAMRRADTTLNPKGTPDHLLTGGPFAVSRNPIYLGATLFLIGIALISANPWILLAAFAAAFLTGKLVIGREERILAERFGKKYRDYAKRVRRWI
ncbi:MAG: isoprenylcysteine carboxylmethyltransferase family protein [Mesorhizobium sp.]|nr:isoprenylcysteine carboxylmethyltransferase family protein [Mesorhizobium sp.]MBN9243184.1 isoprenylcysteine carboxylmethyltransferase family protein [Mesorhizobium sp.]MBN9270400.1 isoprenylcysteine carboxylmethyltransferase family protein [Mesorhizobium sp.]